MGFLLLPIMTGHRSLSSQQRGLECTGNRRSALTCHRSIADQGDLLPRLREVNEVLARRLSRPVIEPLTERWCGQDATHSWPATHAEIEQHWRNAPEPESVLRASRNHNAIEWRQQFSRAGDVNTVLKRHALLP